MVSIIKHENILVASSWDDIKTMATTGKIKEGDQISIEFDGKQVLHDVIGINAEELAIDNPDQYISITIQMHDLIPEERSFDTKGRWGSNVWETSELRQYLNGEEFMSRYSGLKEYLAPVKKKNNSGDDTVGSFFLLSKEEIEQEDTPYPHYRDKRNRVKFNPDGYADWHWTRSANRGGAYGAWYVYSSGNVSYFNAVNSLRFAPACVLIFPIS